MRPLLLLTLLVPAIASASGPRITSGSGTISTGPRILGEPAFAFELDALSQSETTRPGWPVTTTRASGATCIGGHSVAANVACISAGGLECFAAGVGGRTAADVHTVSTAGWPVASGRIDFQYTGDALLSASVATILDTRSPTTGMSGMVLYVSSSGWRLQFADATTTHTVLIGPVATIASSYAGSIRWGASGATVTINGITADHPAAPLMDAHFATAKIGSNRVGANPANGSIRLIRVSP